VEPADDETPPRKAAEEPRRPARRARLVRPGELWGRRSVAVGVVLVGAALVGGLVLLVVGGGDDGSGSKTSHQTSQLQDKFLQHTVVVPDKGISVRRPDNWKDSKNGGAVALQSRDRCLAMTLSAPQDADKAKGLRDDSIALFKRSFKNAKVRPAPDSPVGGIPTTSDALSVTDQKGNPIQVLLSVGTGERFAYLTEIVVRNPYCQGDLQLAQVVLSSIQYTK
jgi:hypothetical protein